MTRTTNTGSDAWQRGNDIYETDLRSRVEMPENIGKQIVIDVESGDYEIGDNGLAISHAVKARHPDARLIGLRIGFDAVYAIGGVLSRTTSETS
ncbi:MAG: hypothetical protein H8F28_07050 [Fibrella sp.]|nr:hypothetical protein [Armatimonadota bacterium]